MTALGELGLSSYEEKVVRTLLVTGPATAATLSESSGVPTGRIYDVLNGLDARGLVRTQSTEPTRYVPADPEATVGRLLAERWHELEQEWARYCEVASEVRSNLVPTRPTDSSFFPGSLGDDEMVAALREQVRTAEQTVHAAVGESYGNAGWETIQHEVEAFLDGASRDVSVAVLVSESVLDALPAGLVESIQDRPVDVAVNVRSDVGLSFDVVDRAETAIDVPHPVAADDRLGVVGIRDADAVAAVEGHFRRLWSESEPVLG